MRQISLERYLVSSVTRESFISEASISLSHQEQIYNFHFFFSHRCRWFHRFFRPFTSFKIPFLSRVFSTSVHLYAVGSSVANLSNSVYCKVWFKHRVSALSNTIQLLKFGRKCDFCIHLSHLWALVIYFVLFILMITAAWLAQLVGRQTTVRKVIGSTPVGNRLRTSCLK